MSDRARRRNEAALRGFFRGLGMVLGPIVLFCGVPVGACRSVCVPYQTLCEEAGGLHVEIADVVHHCQMRAPVDAAHPCPLGFEPAPDHPSACSATSLVPAACAPPWQRF